MSSTQICLDVRGKRIGDLRDYLSYDDKRELKVNWQKLVADDNSFFRSSPEGPGPLENLVPILVNLKVLSTQESGNYGITHLGRTHLGVRRGCTPLFFTRRDDSVQFDHAKYSHVRYDHEIFQG